MHFPSRVGVHHEEEQGDVCNHEMLAELKGWIPCNRVCLPKSEMTNGEGLA